MTDLKRWVNVAGKSVVVPEIDAFLAEIQAVCVRHGLSLGHEDGQGAFEVHAYDGRLAEWLSYAHDARIPEGR